MKIIYKTTNLIDGKFYVGQHHNDDDNYLGSGKDLKDAIDKVGRENFKRDILEYCSSDVANKREEYWIRELFAVELGYNKTKYAKGGDNFTNNPNKEEIRKAMSESRKGKYVGEKNHMYGRRRPDLSMRNKLNPLFGEKNGNYGRQFTEDHRRKLSEAFKKRECTEEMKQRLRVMWVGRKHTDETRRKMSESAKRFWANKQKGGGSEV